VYEGERPPYVPWNFGFTLEAREKVSAHFGPDRLEQALDNHLLGLGNDIGFFREVEEHVFEDVFGVRWDRSVDKDIGIVCNCVLPEPTLKGYEFPDPRETRYFEDIPRRIAEHGDRFRVFQIGFSLYERAWTLRGMTNLMMDFIEHPAFVRELVDAIVDYNIAQVREALKYDIDAVHFGDDWGQQRGLQMGPEKWREFMAPALRRMYGVARDAGKYVSIHSCGDVDELFDDLIDLGLNCFNPFQPEVMEVEPLMKRYRGRLAFYGGLSTQRTLPYGSAEDVRAETRRLIELGREGGYILAPAHGVEGDVPLENMLAFIEEAQAQEGYRRSVGSPGASRRRR
jgi:uroporphyrinogen decarboxylase